MPMSYGAPSSSATPSEKRSQINEKQVKLTKITYIEMRLVFVGVTAGKCG